jgi:hypothetical protein
MKCRTQFWKRTTQGSFQQSLIEIGSVVSEEKIFFNSSQHRTLREIHIKIFSSETTGPIATKLWWNDPWTAPFQNCVRWSRLPTGWTAGHIFGREPSNDYLIKILFLLSKWFQTRRFLWEFPIGSYVKLSSASPLKLLSQSRPNFTEMILGWFPSKFMSGISDLWPRWPPQPNLI